MRPVTSDGGGYHFPGYLKDQETSDGFQARLEATSSSVVQTVRSNAHAVMRLRAAVVEDAGPQRVALVLQYIQSRVKLPGRSPPEAFILGPDRPLSGPDDEPDARVICLASSSMTGASYGVISACGWIASILSSSRFCASVCFPYRAGLFVAWMLFCAVWQSFDLDSASLGAATRRSACVGAAHSKAISLRR
jgi:hypothetical protein